jgi:hypothetical protein
MKNWKRMWKEAVMRKSTKILSELPVSGPRLNLGPSEYETGVLNHSAMMFGLPFWWGNTM